MRVTVVALAFAALLAWPAAAAAPRAAGGGTFRVISTPGDLDYMDPALAYTTAAWSLLDASCALLMRTPDRQAPASFRLAPEVAVAPPRSSDHARTFTFTLKTGFRFSDGSPVTAAAFAHAIDRLREAGTSTAAAPYVSDIAGVKATGNRLVVHLRTSAPDFPARTAMPFFCPVPPGLPFNPEGVPTFPGSGPYTVSEYVPGQRVVLSRNPYYRGTRSHHVDGIVADLTASSPQDVLQRVERGEADWGPVAPPFYYDPALGLVAKYGINKSRLLAAPGLVVRGYALNMARPLFRNNLPLRRAVNFAVDRPALINAPLTPHGIPSDQYLPSGIPGFRDAHIYPVDGPDVRKAKALARGHTRGGKAVLWTFDVPSAMAAAQTVRRNLKAIGLDVTIRGYPGGALGGLVTKPGAPYDMVFSPWLADYVDPAQFLNTLLDSRYIGTTNFSRFHSAKYDALMRHAALLEGAARSRAYGDLDVQLSRDAAPRIAIANDDVTTFVSKRVGCIVLRPDLDLAVACLK